MCIRDRHYYATANQVIADTAGLTTNVQNTPTITQASPTEVAQGYLHTDVGQLGYLFGHTALHAVAVPLEIATNSIKTSLGGLVRGHGGTTIAPADMQGYTQFNYADANSPTPVDAAPVTTFVGNSGSAPQGPGPVTIQQTLRQQWNLLTNTLGITNGR